MSGPGSTDEATESGDRVGKVAERVDDDFSSLVAALEPVEGVGAFDVPTSTGLDRSLVALMCDAASQVSAGQLVTSVLRVVSGMYGIPLGRELAGAKPTTHRCRRRRWTSSTTSVHSQM